MVVRIERRHRKCGRYMGRVEKRDRHKQWMVEEWKKGASLDGRMCLHLQSLREA
jgi:hypothetical protein